MDDIELEIAIAEEEARARQRSVVRQPAGSAPGSRYEQNAEQNIGNLINANKAFPDAVPLNKDTLTGSAIGQGAKDLAHDAIALGTPALATAAMGPLGSVVGSPVTRALGYAGNAAIDAGINFASNKVQQDIGLQKPTSLGEDAQNALSTAALDVAIPGAFDVASAGIRGASGLMNTPKGLARNFGATSGQMNETVTRKPVGAAIEELMQNQEFKDNVVGNVSINRAFQNTKAMRQATGADIGEIYKKTGGLQIDTAEILKHPSILDIQNSLLDPYSSFKNKAEVEAEFNAFLELIKSKPSHEVADLWTARRAIDNTLDLSKQSGQFTEGDATNEALRFALSDNITTALTQAGGRAEDILVLNNKYNNLKVVESALARRNGTISDDNLFGFDTTQYGKLSTYLKMAAAASAASAGGAAAATAAGVAAPYVAGNPGRALLFKAGQALTPSMAGTVSQGMGMVPDNSFQGLPGFSPSLPADRAPQVPREWDSIKTDTMHIGAVDQMAIALGIASPGMSIKDMPNDMAKKAVGMVAQQFPDMFVPTPDKINAINGEYATPIDKDMVVSQALDLPPTERAKIIGGSFRNKYIPITQTPPVVAPQIPALPATLDKMSENLNSVFQSPVMPDYTIDKSKTSQLEELTNAQNRHLLN